MFVRSILIALLIIVPAIAQDDLERGLSAWKSGTTRVDQVEDDLDTYLDELELVETPESHVLAAPIALRVEPVALAAAKKESDGRPWSVQRELDDAGAPDWLRVSGSIRLRYEGTFGQFRSAARLDNQDHVFVIRTLLKVAADFEDFAFVFEGEDSRQYGGNFGSALGTSTVNAVELLQAHFLVRFGDVGPGKLELRGGRLTFDLGSRRFVARNRFRNTINSFTGLHLEWKGENFKLTTFYTLPVVRLPGDLRSIVDNEVDFDEETFEFQFFGVHFEHHDLLEDHTLEAFAYALLDDRIRSRERDIFTVGFRIYLPKAKGEFDYQLEAAYQFGNSETSASGPELDHNAGFVHASVGYTFDADWKPRVRLAFDYASGDDDPTDGDNNRYDTLFGARRFEFGPTGTFGAIGRFNLLSPEIRLELKPRSDMSWMIAARTFLLASDQDAFVAGRVADPTGSSGRFVGQQLESRWRWDLLQKTLRLEAGVAYIFHGEFQEDAPGGQGTDTLFVYFQTAFKF